MADATDGLFWIRESRLLELCRVKRATWRAWDKDGLVESDPGGAYSEADALALVLLLAIRDHLNVKDTALAWHAMKHARLDDHVIQLARELDDDGRLELIIEPETRVIRYAADDASLARAVRFVEDPRAVIVIPMEGKLRRVRDGFRVLRETTPRPAKRHPGRPARVPARVHTLGKRGA